MKKLKSFRRAVEIRRRYTRFQSSKRRNHIVVYWLQGCKNKSVFLELIREKYINYSAVL